jgi:hypothetical protein
MRNENARPIKVNVSSYKSVSTVECVLLSDKKALPSQYTSDIRAILSHEIYSRENYITILPDSIIITELLQ